MSTLPPPPPAPPPFHAPFDATRELEGPSIGLLATGILGALVGFFGLVTHLIGSGFVLPFSKDLPDQVVSFISGISGIAGAVVSLLVAGLLIYASTEMRKARQWGLAFAASVMAMIPCVSPCCLVGLPIGIWSLTVLVKPEVKAAFH
jgi:hypothetical protein